jgi:hypothetical protein
LAGWWIIVPYQYITSGLKRQVEIQFAKVAVLW